MDENEKIEKNEEQTSFKDKVPMSICLNGRIEYEWCLELRTHLKNLHKNHPATEFILDLNDLDFIGSSSILHFVDVVKFLHREGLQLKLTNVQIEFIKVFQLYQLFEVDILPPQPDKVPYTSNRSIGKKIKAPDAEGHA